MDPQLRARAESRLQEAAETLHLADPRPAYRDRLRRLREQHPDAFTRAIAHYETTVLQQLATSDDPIAAWVDYGAFVAGLSDEGRAYDIDETGRALPFQPPARHHHLVLFVPESSAAEVLILAAPAAASAAQNATVDLLVNRRLTLRD